MRLIKIKPIIYKIQLKIKNNSDYSKMKISILFFILGAFFGASGVILAATGWHLFDLGNSLSANLFHYVVFFQIMHAVLLMWLATQIRKSFWLLSSAITFSLGVIIFCGSLYVLLLVGASAKSWITPLGGSFLVLGWINLIIYGFFLLKK